MLLQTFVTPRILKPATDPFTLLAQKLTSLMSMKDE